jgi:hypothetical protein
MHVLSSESCPEEQNRRVNTTKKKDGSITMPQNHSSPCCTVLGYISTIHIQLDDAIS